MKSVYLIAAITIFLCSCKVLHQKRENTEVSDEFRTEYDFSLIEAQKQMMFGNYARAKTLYQRCLELKSINAAVYFQLANLYITNGNYETALNYARRAFRIDQRNEWYILQLAQIYKITNKLDSTIYCYQLLVKSNPKYEYKITLALLYLRANWLNSALKLLNSIELEYGESVPTITNKYKVYILKNENQKCILLLKNAIQKFPQETQYYGLLGEHFSTIGNYESALENFAQLLRIDPANEKGFLSVIDLYKKYKMFSLAVDSAESFVKRKEFTIDNKIGMLSGLLSDKMDSVYSDCVSEMIDSLTLEYPDNIKVAVLKADLYLNLKQYKNAEKQLKDILLKNKMVKIAWEKLFFVLSLNKDFNEINNVSGEAITLFSEDALLYFYRGISLFKLESYHQAIKSLETGLNFANDNKKLLIQIYSLLGECCHLEKEYDKSDVYFEGALKLDPNNVVVLNNYSYDLALRGFHLKLALLYSKRCIKIVPDNGTFLDTYGWVLFKSGKVRKAEEAVGKAIQIEGLVNKNILEHYIEILVKLNKKSEARRYSEILKKFDADSLKANRSDKCKMI